MSLEILILGQVTVDDIVPAEPGAWRRQLGGNALYSAAGARLWLDPSKIGVVARLGRQLPFDVPALFEQAGLATDGLRLVDREFLFEWIVYENDGNRQSLPRNALLRDPAADAPELARRYREHLGWLSASIDDIPDAWHPAAAVHLAPQIPERHLPTCHALARRTGFLSVDPSPCYTRGVPATELALRLRGATAFLPSQAEVQHLLSPAGWGAVADQLCNAGFPEVVLKLGQDGAILRHPGRFAAVHIPAAPAATQDLTGAGDSFCGAYTAARATGLSPEQAAVRGAVAASLIIETNGAADALRLPQQRAEERLARLQTGLA